MLTSTAKQPPDTVLGDFGDGPRCPACGAAMDLERASKAINSLAESFHPLLVQMATEASAAHADGDTPCPIREAFRLIKAGPSDSSIERLQFLIALLSSGEGLLKPNIQEHKN